MVLVPGVSYGLEAVDLWSEGQWEPNAFHSADVIPLTTSHHAALYFTLPAEEA